MTNDTPPAVMLIEDNAVDSEAFVRAMAKVAGDWRIEWRRTGASALDFLTTTSAEEPILVFLDLNLPDMKGREVLDAARRVPGLGHVPIVIFTSSADAEEAADCYRAGAHCFITKPQDFDGLVHVLRSTIEFWRDTALVPALRRRRRNHD